MLGVILLYVGMVLMSNGLHRLEGIPDKSNVVMNIWFGVDSQHYCHCLWSLYRARR